VARYRAEFRPSEQLAEPHVIVGANVVAADDPGDAQEQFETVRRRLVRSMIARRPGTPENSDAQIEPVRSSIGPDRSADRSPRGARHQCCATGRRRSRTATAALTMR